MNLKKLFHIEKDDNVEKDIVYDNVAIPEIHFHHKKKSK